MLRNIVQCFVVWSIFISSHAFRSISLRPARTKPAGPLSQTRFGCPKVKSTMGVHQSNLPFADLTPAIDKYPIVPPIDYEFQKCILRDNDVSHGRLDPFSMVKKELLSLTEHMEDLLKSESFLLTQAASHFFKQRQGKRFRPTIVALLGRAISPNPSEYINCEEKDKHLRLAQLVEMIHVASLMHDDVIDESTERRGGSALHSLYSNKVAILAGDFLLARASVQLARLQHSQVVEIISSALDSLVQGEIMQARSSAEELLDISFYLRKSYMKTASLICNSCKATSLLSGYDENSSITKACERFGNHLGLAFQIIDDILDYAGSSSKLGKPAQADMKLGLATAPLLYASQEIPELRTIIKRKFKQTDDIPRALTLSSTTKCVEKSHELADFHAQQALGALHELPVSDYQVALINLLRLVITRES